MLKAFGRDSVVPEPDGTVTLVCREPKGWEARKARTMTSSEHPGSAILWDESLWEVLSVEPGHPGVRYRLGAWHDCHVVRVHHVYDAGTEEVRIREARRHADAARLRLLILAAAPLTGLLPGSVQSRWEKELGVPAVRLTVLGSVLPFIVGTASLVFFIAAAFGGLAPPGFLLPMVWFFPESLFRFNVAMSQGIPVGSVPGVVFWFVWRGIAGRGSRLALLIAALVAGAADGTAIAGESPVVVGLRAGAEAVAASKYSNQAEDTAGELFVRYFLGPSVALEAAAGYRTTSYNQGSGLTATSFSMSQVPLTAGATWVFSPKQTFRPRLGAGIAVLPTKTKATSSRLPDREEVVETSTTVIGGYAEGGLQLPIYENLNADVLFRFVLNPVPLESERPSSQNYFSALFGLSARF